jgi:hypothetical protein
MMRAPSHRFSTPGHLLQRHLHFVAERNPWSPSGIRLRGSDPGPLHPPQCMHCLAHIPSCHHPSSRLTPEWPPATIPLAASLGGCLSAFRTLPPLDHPQVSRRSIFTAPESPRIGAWRPMIYPCVPARETSNRRLGCAKRRDKRRADTCGRDDPLRKGSLSTTMLASSFFVENLLHVE